MILIFVSLTWVTLPRTSFATTILRPPRVGIRFGQGHGQGGQNKNRTDDDGLHVDDKVLVRVAFEVAVNLILIHTTSPSSIDKGRKLISKQFHILVMKSQPHQTL